MKKVVSAVIILIIILLAVFIYLSIQKEQELYKENISTIENNYSKLTDDVNNYNSIRKELNDKITNFFYDKYLKEKESYEEILNKYNDIIVKIDNDIANINSKCDVIYKDIEINKICNSYKTLYEKLVNLYVKDINNYNHKITGYNEYANKNEELFKMIHEDYIDYNEDGNFEGNSSNEEETN